MQNQKTLISCYITSLNVFVTNNKKQNTIKLAPWLLKDNVIVMATQTSYYI